MEQGTEAGKQAFFEWAGPGAGWLVGWAGLAIPLAFDRAAFAAVRPIGKKRESDAEIALRNWRQGARWPLIANPRKEPNVENEQNRGCGLNPPVPNRSAMTGGVRRLWSSALRLVD
jgi:hypothetical protein